MVHCYQCTKMVILHAYIYGLPYPLNQNTKVMTIKATGVVTDKMIVPKTRVRLCRNLILSSSHPGRDIKANHSPLTNCLAKLQMIYLFFNENLGQHGESWYTLQIPFHIIKVSYFWFVTSLLLPRELLVIIN